MRSSISAAIAFCFLVASVAHAGTAAEDGFDLAGFNARIRPSVAFLERRSGGEVEGNGTGFVVRESGWVVTNHHVVEGATDMVARFHDGTERRVLGIIADSAATDLAIVKIEGEGYTPLPIGSIEQAPEGTPIAVLGHPAGFGWTLSEGIISARRPEGMPDHLKDDPKAPKGPILQFTADSTHGSSGSPVLSRTGSVVGVVQGSLGLGEIRFAIAADSVQKLLAEAKEENLRPLQEFPFRNLAISAVVFGAIGGWFWVDSRRRRNRSAVWD
ncbi:MAG: serine protease [Myxococcaceae bacterium]